MPQPDWLDPRDIDEIVAQLAVAFPSHLIRPLPAKRNDLLSGLDRPHHRFAYGGDGDLLNLAAEYVFGITKAHAFVDGNKRVALHAALVFLGRNYVTIDEPVPGYLDLPIRRLVTSEISVEQLGAILREYARFLA